MNNLTVVPVGAGSNFIGYLQQYMNKGTLASVDLKAKRKKNCWNEYNINSDVEFFIDCDKDTFTWCYKLANIKENKKMAKQNEINKSWDDYLETKVEYSLKLTSFNYLDIFERADPKICEEFLRKLYTSSKPLYPTFKIDNAINMIKQYNKRNKEILAR